jgi:hypothetical protein
MPGFEMSTLNVKLAHLVSIISLKLIGVSGLGKHSSLVAANLVINPYMPT